MKIKKLIKELEKHLAAHGNVDVTFTTVTNDCDLETSDIVGSEIVEGDKVEISLLDSAALKVINENCIIVK